MHDAAQGAAHGQRRRPDAQRAAQLVRLDVRYVGAQPVLPRVRVQVQIACTFITWSSNNLRTASSEAGILLHHSILGQMHLVCSGSQLSWMTQGTRHRSMGTGTFRH